MDEGIHMREATSADVETVVEIALAAWAPIFAHYREMLGPELYTLESPDPLRRKEDEIRRAFDPDTRTHVYVAEKAGGVVAFVTFFIDPERRIGRIGNNAVRPEFQGMGLGPRMYQFVFDRMREMGMLYAKVITGGDPAHAPARRAYEKVGFHIQRPHLEYFRKL
jgi:GNAT superfamily N-acetyltransferase